MTDNGKKFCDVCNDMENVKTYQIGSPFNLKLTDLCEKCKVFFEGLPMKEISDVKRV